MEEIKKILIQARFEMKRNWLKAMQLLEDGQESYPDCEDIALELAQLHILQKRFADAIKVCQKTLLFKHNDQLCYLIGCCFLNLGEYEIAVDYLERVRDEFPEHLYNKAVALARCNRFDEAIMLTEKVMSYRVKSPVPHLLLAELFFIKKEYAKSVEICDQVERIYGASGELYFMRGMSWRAQNNIIRAYWDFHEAEKFKIFNPEYYRNYGLVAEGIGKTEKAIGLLKEAIRLAPGNVGAYMELFRLYLANNLLLEASTLLKQARSTLPESFPLTVMYNRVIDRLQDADHYE
ncbi:MAG: tetratricopeptide repeat protein [Candidatus Cloacimonetes bacterium]|nr:tetratricopeptide repeat protein [Candidatus Cloacimonadota bacterium]